MRSGGGVVECDFGLVPVHMGPPTPATPRLRRRLRRVAVICLIKELPNAVGTGTYVRRQTHSFIGPFRRALPGGGAPWSANVTTSTDWRARHWLRRFGGLNFGLSIHTIKRRVWPSRELNAGASSAWPQSEASGRNLRSRPAAPRASSPTPGAGRRARAATQSARGSRGTCNTGGSDIN